MFYPNNNLLRSMGMALVFVTFTPFLAAGATTRPASGERFPIHAWIGIPAEQTSFERYKELGDCGFTTSFSTFPDIGSTAKALDAAGAAGIKLFIHLPELAMDPEGTVRRFMNHPALAGYHLRDEPSAADFPQLAEWTRRIQGIDRDHPCYINLFPTYASAAQLGTATYQEHVDRLVREVAIPFISFDHYPIVGERVRPEWYANLETIRRASVSAGKPFWAFCLAVPHGPYPMPTLPHLRLQAFSNLAYGAQCIQYFTYWTPIDPTWDFHDAPIDPQGRRTPTYDRVKQINQEIQAMAPIFLNSQVLSIWHTGQVPEGAQPFKPVSPVKSLETQGSGALVSLLAQPKHRYLIIVNRDFINPMAVQISFDLGGTPRLLDKALAPHALPGNTDQCLIAPGDIRIYTWPADQSPSAPHAPIN